MKDTAGITDGNRRRQHFKCIHLVDVVNAAHAKQRHDEESAASAEVSDIDADDDHAHDEQLVVPLAAGEGLQPSAEWES